MRKNFSDEYGQSMILIALVTVGLLGILGLVLDGGDAYLTRRDAQNASDSAAFAGAQALRGKTPSDSAIRAIINQYAQANHVVDGGADVTAYYLDQYNNEITTCQIGSCGAIPGGVGPGGATGVVVTSTITFQSFFLGMINGGGPFTLPAHAKVQTGSLTSPGAPLVPMAVPLPTDCPPDQSWSGDPDCKLLQPGQPVDLFGTTTGSGNLQWLNLGAVDPNPVSPCNEDCIAQYISQSRTPTSVKIGDWLYATTGVSVNKCNNGTPDSSIICALNYWLDKPYAERRWIVPIYQTVRDPTGNNLEYQVIAFAAFYPTGYNFGNGNEWSRNFANNELCIDPFTLLPPVDKNGNPDKNAKCIKGEFQGFVTPTGEADPGKQCNVNPLNVCGIQLQE